MRLHYLYLFLHIAGVVVWVGGMAFAYLCLRPAVGALAPQDRLGLWVAVLGRFFRLVWLAVLAVVGSGFGMLLEVGMDRAPPAWHGMVLTGLVMAAVFLHIWFVAWPRLQQTVEARDWARGAAALDLIRRRVGFNLVLGFLTIALATLGLGF